ncbi:MAG: hypothetical protein QOE19_2044, partial [Actinomycetota bacterium]|nr:hypothetical protein [Actinomycetota bacterium]
PGMEVGMVLHFQGGSVGVANLGDEIVVGPWPGDTWMQHNVVEQRRA